MNGLRPGCYETLTTRISLPKLRNLSSNSLKTSLISQDSPNLSLVLIHATSVVHLLECRAGNTAAHVRGSGRRHQRRITQVVDFLLPLLHRLWCCIDTRGRSRMHSVPVYFRLTCLDISLHESPIQGALALLAQQVYHMNHSTF